MQKTILALDQKLGCPDTPVFGYSARPALGHTIRSQPCWPGVHVIDVRHVAACVIRAPSTDY
jgi:hypothetical protein